MLTVEKSAWETRLIDWAHEAADGQHHSDPILSGVEMLVRPPVLEQAFRFCDEITRSHSRTFYLASNLLPEEKRQAVRALYAFCRISDDLVDRNGSAHYELESWRRRTLYSRPARNDMVALAWSDTRLRYRSMDVFHRRAHIDAWGKLRRLPSIWLRSR